MTCVLEVHTLHLEFVMRPFNQESLRDSNTSERAESAEPEPEPRPFDEQERSEIPTASQLLEAFIQVEESVAKTSVRWSAVLLIETAITVVIALEPLLFAVIQSQVRCTS